MVSHICEISFSQGLLQCLPWGSYISTGCLWPGILRSSISGMGGEDGEAFPSVSAAIGRTALLLAEILPFPVCCHRWRTATQGSGAEKKVDQRISGWVSVERKGSGELSVAWTDNF